MATGNSKTTYSRDKILNVLYRQTAFTTPAAIHVGLFTATPGPDGTGGTEVTGGAYARVNATGLFAAPAADTTNGGRYIYNSSQIAFPTATANWGTVGWFAIFDAASAGNMLGWAALAQAIVINNGQQKTFDVSVLTINES